MNCVYSKQTPSDLSYVNLQRPEEFGEIEKSAEHFKTATFFTNPTEREAVFYVHSVGREVAAPNRTVFDELHTQKTVFHFITSGEGFFNGRHVKRGDCLIAERGKPYTLVSKDGRALAYNWVTLSHRSDFSISMLGLDDQKIMFKYNFEAEIRQILYSLQNFSAKTRDVYFFTLGKFFELVSYLRASEESKEIEKGPSSHTRYVSITKELLEESEYRISIEEIAKSIGFSRKYLSMIFCQTMGITLREYITQKKIERAKKLLSSGEASLKTIAFQLNYNDYSSFSRAFKKESGITPHEYLSANAEQGNS